MISGVDLTLYTASGTSFTVGLSRAQMEAVVKVLGLQPTAEGFAMWSDASLERNVLPKLNWKPAKKEA